MYPSLMQQPTFGEGRPRRDPRDFAALGQEHCRYWRFGRCQRGETCFYKHDPQFLGVDRTGSNGVPLSAPIPTYPNFNPTFIQRSQTPEFHNFDNANFGGQSIEAAAAAAAAQMMQPGYVMNTQPAGQNSPPSSSPINSSGNGNKDSGNTVVDGGRRFNGFVRSYSQVNRFGFIGGDEVNQHMGQDVFLHQREITEATGVQKPHLPNGCNLSFSVVRNQKGQPQARDVKFEDGPMAVGGEEESKANTEAVIARFVADARQDNRAEEGGDSGRRSRRSRSRSRRRNHKVVVSQDGML